MPTAGRPQKVPSDYPPVWARIRSDVLAELDLLASEIAASVPAGINVTRQDALRGVLDKWYAERVAARAKRGGKRRATAA